MAKISESMIQDQLIQVINRSSTKRVFRNNVGTATTSGGRFISFGLHKGSGDLIGWETIEITQDMVGEKIARFLSVEVKNDKGVASPEQKTWFDIVNNAGGRAIIARSKDDLK